MTEEQKAVIVEAVARRYTELHRQHRVPFAYLWDEMEEVMQNIRWNEAALHIEVIGLWPLIERLEVIRNGWWCPECNEEVSDVTDDNYHEDCGTYVGEEGCIDLILAMIPGYKEAQK